MTLPLNREVLESAYEFLKTTPPFKSWNLPEGEDMRFHVVRTPNPIAFYRRESGKHAISVSSACVGHTATLVQVIAHEMIHLHEALIGLESAAQHGKSFHQFASRVCKFHGFDPKGFV